MIDNNLLSTHIQETAQRMCDAHRTSASVCGYVCVHVCVYMFLCMSLCVCGCVCGCGCGCGRIRQREGFRVRKNKSVREREQEKQQLCLLRLEIA